MLSKHEKILLLFFPDDFGFQNHLFSTFDASPVSGAERWSFTLMNDPGNDATNDGHLGAMYENTSSCTFARLYFASSDAKGQTRTVVTYVYTY